MSEIEQSGIYPDLPEAQYHAQRSSLSASGIKTLTQHPPAVFKWQLDNPRTESTDAQEFGSVVHELLFGVGQGFDVIEADSFRTKVASEAAKESRANGRVPILTAKFTEAQAMVDSVKSHPVAGMLFSQGEAEQSMFWRDPETGAMLRLRCDWLPDPGGGRLIMVDLKTSKSADEESFGKSAADYGYATQSLHYREGAKALGLHDDPAFVFVVVEKEPPYLVNVIQLDVVADDIARAQRRAAIDTFARCMESGRWPGYGEAVNLASLPYWYVRKFEESAA